ncbi:response regulator [Candidatus Woesearchaeota archaeon]|nr:response regulator [Candidatus Woesearchaeota archaeon]MBT5273121.1 response regulator [Candidatus Woesearchaeota archaeon]MBT6040608.1 response regulator [Candidatus Woesearchaeota archaeon]MBT6337564.1 response regulator [Candidatus Woesearchaeota archaeon]MBT7927035.1 response regulator [Candidatus Woesearchaeota archaeon]
MKKILIVDDQYALRELVELTLESDYEIIKSESGQDALKKIEEKVPDLILLDIMMPSMDGYQLCQILRSMEKTKNIPIIMFSAKHQPEDIKKAKDLGANEYITKPFEPDKLKKKIDEILKTDVDQKKEDYENKNNETSKTTDNRINESLSKF